MLADASGHLAPATPARAPRKLDRDGCRIFLYHLGPAVAAELWRELAALELPGVRVLGRGERLEWTAGRRVSPGGVS